MGKRLSRIGVDVGGTKIEAIALAEDGTELHRQRVATPQGDYQGTIEAIIAMVGQLEIRFGIQATVGLGIPGAMDRDSGLVKNANSVCLIGQPLQTDLESALERSIRITNDANCFVVSEAVDGAAVGAEIVFGVIVGTGCGGGIAIRGEAINGLNAIAGEWGHNALPWSTAAELDGALCYCGHHGCIETWLSGPGFVRDYRNNGGAASIDAADIVLRAAGGESCAEAALARYEDRMARSLASVINIIDPDIIVLGGGMSNVSRLYQNVPKLWQQYVFTNRCKTPLVPPLHGDSNGVRGAAWLWSDGEVSV
jgi:fructokinase